MKRINKNERKLKQQNFYRGIHSLKVPISKDKGLRRSKLLKAYPMFSKASIYHHATKPIQAEIDRFWSVFGGVHQSSDGFRQVQLG